MANEGKFSIKNFVFKDGDSIPINYTCDGENINPSFVISGVPEGAVSLVLIAEDPDIEKRFLSKGTFDHWLVWNIPPQINEIEEGKSPNGVEGKNSAGELGYTGPCPPAGEEHRYFFHLYAIDIMFDLAGNIATRWDLEKAMDSHVLAEAVLMGKYKRKQH